jgi:hypothetical protein
VCILRPTMTATPSASPARPAHVKTPPSLGGAIACLGFFCFLSLFFLGVSIKQASDVMDEMELLRKGEIAEGLILNRHEESGEAGQTYWVEYQIGPLLKDKSSPALHRNQAAVDWDTYSSSRRRSKVLIRYLPAAPEINRLDQQQPLIGDLAVLFFIAIFYAGCIVLVIQSLQNLHHAILLACRGRQAMAQVVDSWVEDGGDRNRYVVFYRFEADPSRSFVHYVAEDNYTAYHNLSVNDHVMVRFVPDRPEICMLKL